MLITFLHSVILGATLLCEIFVLKNSRIYTNDFSELAYKTSSLKVAIAAEKYSSSDCARLAHRRQDIHSGHREIHMKTHSRAINVQ